MIIKKCDGPDMLLITITVLQCVCQQLNFLQQFSHEFSKSLPIHSLALSLKHLKSSSLEMSLTITYFPNKQIFLQMITFFFCSTRI
jgi:hypothetical protein